MRRTAGEKEDDDETQVDGREKDRDRRSKKEDNRDYRSRLLGKQKENSDS